MKKHTLFFQLMRIYEWNIRVIKYKSGKLLAAESRIYADLEEQPEIRETYGKNSCSISLDRLATNLR